MININKGYVTMRAVVFLFQNPKYIVLVAFITTTFLLLLSSQQKYENESSLAFRLGLGNVEGLLVFRAMALDKYTIDKWLELRISSDVEFSKLGEVLFQFKERPSESNFNKPLNELNDNFQILVWKYGKTIEGRHLMRFSGEKIDPLEYCPVKNCDITYSDEAINATDNTTADIVIFHLQRLKGLKDIPKRQNRDQIWAFLTDESPHNTFLNGNNKLSDYNGLFNWSMTYRMNADIPVPYGRTVFKEEPEAYVDVVLNKSREVLVAIMNSNCAGNNHRWKYVEELQKHIKVDVYGRCGPLKTCPGHFKADCPDLDKYLFYLSFENSNCEEYITEKLWWNAYHKDSIPIVMGTTKKCYEKMLPPKSYINIEDFASPAALAQNLLRLNKTGDFKSYYRWKATFEVLNEHGYFKSRSYHYCRICEALNYNSRDPNIYRVYQNLEDYWSVKKDCYPAWDAWKD